MMETKSELLKLWGLNNEMQDYIKPLIEEQDYTIKSIQQILNQSKIPQTNKLLGILIDFCQLMDVGNTKLDNTEKTHNSTKKLFTDLEQAILEVKTAQKNYAPEKKEFKILESSFQFAEQLKAHLVKILVENKPDSLALAFYNEFYDPQSMSIEKGL